MTRDIVEEITRRESERMRALVKADWEALAELLAEDLVHIHATGLIDNKRDYLVGARTKLDYLKVERKSLKVRSLGEVAIGTGVLDQTLRIKGPDTLVELQTATTQVWVRQEGRWRQASFQATRIG